LSARGEWRDWEPTRPLDVDGGIVARSRRGAIGETWWSQRFIALLESFGAGSRLARGRNYARRGQVMELDVEPGIVLARVQGSRYTPYRVRLRTRMLSDAQWRRVEKAMAARALPLAQLLAGEMPGDIEEVFAACRLTLFPRAAELKPSCTCPDWEPVCKHVAAAYYLLAERFDEDPFAIFAWRGRERDELLEHLRARRASAAPGAPRRRSRSAALARSDGAQDVDRREEEPAADGEQRARAAPRAGETCEDLRGFWSAGEGLARLQISPLAGEAPDALLRELGPVLVDGGGRHGGPTPTSPATGQRRNGRSAEGVPPAPAPEELTEVLATAYLQLAHQAQARALD
jgi:uncharacterized Zn finger protein